MSKSNVSLYWEEPKRKLIGVDFRRIREIRKLLGENSQIIDLCLQNHSNRLHFTLPQFYVNVCWRDSDPLFYSLNEFLHNPHLFNFLELLYDLHWLF